MSRVGRSRTQSQTYVTNAIPTTAAQSIPSIQSPSHTFSEPATPSAIATTVTSHETITSVPTETINTAPATSVAPLSTAASTTRSITPSVLTLSTTITKPATLAATPTPPIVPTERRRSIKPLGNKKNKKSRSGQQPSTKDLGRWKPIDDLSLIVGIQQTNDLRLVHQGVKFSCKFTIQEMQNRWYSLLYDEPISRIAVAAMRNLHPEMVESVHSKALYTTQEEELLGTIKSVCIIILYMYYIILSFRKKYLFY